MAEPASSKGIARPKGDDLDRAADRLRDSAKWLVAAFGAVAAVIFAGLTVADLGALDWDTPGHRLLIALAGAAAAISGIVLALTQAMRLAGASTTSLHDLTRPTGPTEFALNATRAELRGDPALAAWNGDAAAFLTDYRAAYENYVQWAEAYASDPGRQPDQTRLRQAVYRLEALAAITSRLLSTTSFLRLQRSFILTRWTIGSLMLVSAAGAVAFGWATSSASGDAAGVAIRPVAAVLRPDAAVAAELTRQVRDCPVEAGAELAVIVLAAPDEATFEIVTIPSGACGPATARVPRHTVKDT